MERLITRKEAAEKLGISPTLLDAARRAGTIRFIRYSDNGRIYFTESALEEFVEKGTHKARRSESILTYRKRRKL